MPFTSYLFYTVAAPPSIYTLSLHDALPIYHGFDAVSTDHDAGAIQILAPTLCYADMPALIAVAGHRGRLGADQHRDRKSTRLNSSHITISYAVFCLKKKKNRNSTDL